MARCAIYAALAAAVSAMHAAETGWSRAVDPRSAAAQQIWRQPMVERPNRPLHLYGNTVRRWHHRGNPLPMPRDLAAAAATIFGR